MTKLLLRLTTTSLLLTLLLTAPVLGNGFERAKPEDVGLSSERLQRIDERMQSYVDSGQISGAMGLIARHGKVAYVQSWGKADRESGAAMKADTIHRIYSMSKPITSVAVMMLHEEGLLNISDPIGKYLPELAKMEVLEESVDRTTGETTKRTYPAKRPITIRDLLRHTAGLTYGVFGNTDVDQMYRAQGLLFADKDLEDFTKKLGTIPLRFEPGTTWHYSVAVDVQGRLVEVVSGQTFDVFLRERIFEPLGMGDTGFYVPEKKLDRFAQLYAPKGTGDGGAETFLNAGAPSKEIEVAPASTSRNYVAKPAFFSGGGGMVSTAYDYLRFSQMMLNGGQLDGVRILSRKTVELMTTDHLGEIPMGFGRTGVGFGLGFAVAKDIGQMGSLGSVGEFNWGGAAGTAFWIDPSEDLIGIYMIQILPHTGLTYGSEFKNFVYSAIDD